MLRFLLAASALLTIGVGLPATAGAQTAVFQPIEHAASSAHTYYAQAVSADGKVVVGYARDYGSDQAYRWTEADGYQDLGSMAGFAEGDQALGVSGDGSTIVGFAKSGATGRAFRWSAGSGMVSLGNPGPATSSNEAHGISTDGQVIVGRSAFGSSSTSLAFRRTSSGTLQNLGDLAPQFDIDSLAYDVSADGGVVVGQAYTGKAFSAFRWQGGAMQSLGTLGPTEFYASYAYGVSADGSVVVGSTNMPDFSTQAFRWTAEGMVALPPVDEGFPQSDAYAVTANGRMIVGKSTKPTTEGGSAAFWIDGEPRSLWEYLVDEHGIDPADYGFGTLYEIRDVSADGSTLVGWGIGNGTNRAFRVTIPRLNEQPTLESSLVDGAVVTVREGEALVVDVDAWDEDAGDELKLEVDGLPAGATLTPPAGTIAVATEQAPFRATFRWTPGEADVNVPRDVTLSFRDEIDAVASLSFTIEVRSNEAPTVAAVTPVVVECVDGRHLVDLATTVDDPDGDRLTVTWKVDGSTVKRTSVAAGATAAYSGIFDHGTSDVEVVVSDGILSAATTTTVTVEDTLNPTIVITPQIELSTDPGEAFASKSRLTPPTAEDASGHKVTFANDAPARLPLGRRMVTWTATDVGGNQVAAAQTVFVRDREKPTLGALSPVSLFCDPGKTYATVRLRRPTVSDNAPGTIAVSSSANSRLPIGTHRVVWTAVDAAGNRAFKTQAVTVVNRKPRANAGRDLVVTTASAKGARISLDGSASSDPDRQTLKYRWTAPGVQLKNATTARPSGVFPVGKKTVKLVVIDAGGLKHTDIVQVTVKLKNGKRRPRGGDANRSFAAAAEGAKASVAGVGGARATSGLAYANAAARLGDVAGEFVQPDEGRTQHEALLRYAEVRALQRRYGEAAARELLAAYAETGDENLLSAFGDAAEGAVAAAADLTEP